MLGAIASTVLPGLIDWGMKKLSSTNIGRGMANKVGKVRAVMAKPMVQQVIGAISG